MPTGSAAAYPSNPARDHGARNRCTPPPDPCRTRHSTACTEFARPGDLDDLTRCGMVISVRNDEPLRLHCWSE